MRFTHRRAIERRAPSGRQPSPRLRIRDRPYADEAKWVPETMKPPQKGRKPATYAPPTPRVSRLKKAKVLTAAERAAFLASRPDLKPKG